MLLIPLATNVPTTDIQEQPPELFYNKNVLKNFAKFTIKHLCQSLLLNKVAGLVPVTLLKKRLCHRCFPVNFAKFLRRPFLQNTSEPINWLTANDTLGKRNLTHFHIIKQHSNIEAYLRPSQKSMMELFANLFNRF